MKYSKYPSYKDSGVEWLGEVPEEWSIKPFWTLYKRDKKTGYPNETLLSVYRDYGVIQKSSRDDNNNKASEDLSAYQLVSPSDLAMNKMKAWQGSLGVSEHKGIVSPAYFVFESLHNQYDQYLHHLMRSPRYIAGYLSISKGIRVNQWDLDPQCHSRMPIVLPSLQEQQTIVNYLDKATAKMDTLIEKQTRLIGLLKEKRQVVISTAVTRGLDSTVTMTDSGIEWLGKTPKYWTVNKIKNICYINDGNHGEEYPSEEDYTEPAFGIPFIRPGHIKNLQVVSVNMMHITKEKNTSMRKGNLQYMDILFTNRGEIGKVALIGKEHIGANLNSQIAYIRPDKTKIIAKYLAFSLISDTVRYMKDSISAGSVLTQFPIKDLNNIPVIYPDIQEQQEIVYYLDEKTTKIDSLITKATQAIDLLKEKRTTLISAAVTGKIDVREAA